MTERTRAVGIALLEGQWVPRVVPQGNPCRLNPSHGLPKTDKPWRLRLEFGETLSPDLIGEGADGLRRPRSTGPRGA